LLKSNVSSADSIYIPLKEPPKGGFFFFVYLLEAVRDLANKDQQGFVSDNEFNSFARIAQLNIFNGLFDELKDSKRLSRSGFNPNRDKDRRKRVLEDLSAFSTTDTVTKSSGVFSVTAASGADMARIISIKNTHQHY